MLNVVECYVVERNDITQFCTHMYVESVCWFMIGHSFVQERKRTKNVERFTILRVILAQGPC